jgi:ubiquitin-like 1-activating enzyme E1 A
MAAISEGEVAVYDRQLRLWGVQAQQKLLKSKVLIWGLEGSNVEACKNLVLAGVSLVIRDHRKVSAADVSFNYFLRKEDLGQSLAECAARRVQEMNPLCGVSASTSGPEEDGLGGFDLVVVGLRVLGMDVCRASAIDAACRKANARFVFTMGVGELVFFFSDLGSHTVQEYSSAQGSAGPAPDAKSPEPEHMQFPSFAEFLDCSVETLQGQKQKVDASVLLVSLLLAFLRSGGAPPGPGAGKKFEEYCAAAAPCPPALPGGPGLQQVYGSLFVEPLIHVASILGGLLAQEVIKALTARDKPLMNCVCFNAHAGVAFVERVPPALSAPPRKRKAEEEVADLID